MVVDIQFLTLPTAPQLYSADSKTFRRTFTNLYKQPLFRRYDDEQG